MVSPVATKTLMMRAMPEEVLMSAYQLSSDEARKLKFKQLAKSFSCELEFRSKVHLKSTARCLGTSMQILQFVKPKRGWLHWGMEGGSLHIANAIISLTESRSKKWEGVIGEAFELHGRRSPRCSPTAFESHLVSSDKSKLPVKEFVQCTPFDSLFVKSGHEEQFFTVPIPPDIVRLALSQGYTHMHFGAIRFAVTFHGRKGLQAVARIALVDSRLTNYQQAILGNVQATLNAGTVFFTLYPNFNVPLSDPFVCSALKVQVQITGVSMVPGTAAATIHQQMVYRVQNHSYDLCIPGSSTSEALMLTIDSEASHTAKYVPRQLTRAELVTLLPEVWVTSYEKLQEQNNTEPLQQIDPTYLRRADKQIEMRGPLQVPHSDGSNAKIIEWFPTNLAKSIREPYNVNFVIFLQNMCAKNGVDFNKVPEYVKYDDPWKNHDEANPPLFERLFNYAERHNWSYGEISSDSDGMDSTDEEDEGVNVAAELDDLAHNSDGDGSFNDEPNTPIYGGTPDHYWYYDDDGNETD
ncbi:hypothetical protein LguiB_035620 [Lonicera macranthoides]